ncbi:MAG TPA: di-heme enzyme [Woeseiaceae bacterium]|nr:di-heme enzyme [Woeseiaceae bacterium]
MRPFAVAAAAVALAAAAGVAALLVAGREGYEWTLPAGVPPPPVPDDNPMSAAKVELGRRLFYDTRLSVNGSMACATCHRQELAFTDGRARSIGATGEVHPRGAMTLANAGYASRLTWANPLLDTLEVQALTPLFGDDPVEMGMAGREADIVELVRSDPWYRAAFEEAFPSDAKPWSTLNVVRAIAAFVRTIVSFDSPYDRYLRGDESALSPSAVRGMQLFFSERLECFHCHGGFNFTDSSTHANAIVTPFGFHNNGLYNIGSTGAYPPDNTGLHDITGERRDMGRFKAPTLRNVAVTAPYMHDGSMRTLDEVVEHYRRGGRLVEDGPYAGDGRRNPYKSAFVRGFELTAEEKMDLIAFLASLTDLSLLTNPRYADPCRATSNLAENCVSRHDQYVSRK